MLKQRRDSASQYDDAGSVKLGDIERAEMVVIEDFMPAAFTEDDLDGLIRGVISSTAAQGTQDMGRVMNELRLPVLGQVDMGHLGKKVRAALVG